MDPAEISDIIILVAVSTIVIVLFAVGYLLSIYYSNRKIVELQNQKIIEVQKGKKQYEDLFRNSLAGMMRFNFATWEIEDANTAMHALCESANTKELTMRFQAFSDTVKSATEIALTEHAIINELEIETEKRNGEKLWLLFSAKRIEDTSIAQAVMIDITVRKLYEEQIQTQAALIEESGNSIIVTDIDGKITYLNPAAEILFGWGKEELLGRTVGEMYFGKRHEKEYHDIMISVNAASEWSGEQWQQRKDHKEILVESHWKVFDLKNSRTKNILIINSDITEKVKLNAQLVRSQKMSFIALLTSGLAHDLQNILAPIALSANMLEQNVKGTGNKKSIHSITESAHSGLELVRKILSYGKSFNGEREVLDLKEILSLVEENIKAQLPAKITFVANYHKNIPQVLGERQQLFQVFLNLLVNARDAIRDKGKIRLSIEMDQPSEQLLHDHEVTALKRYIAIVISDTGKGIPKQFLPKIFEPFFTTKDGKYGTGLGLSLVEFIVRMHEGFIVVKSRSGAGTTMRVYLPVLDSE